MQYFICVLKPSGKRESYSNGFEDASVEFSEYLKAKIENTLQISCNQLDFMSMKDMKEKVNADKEKYFILILLSESVNEDCSILEEIILIARNDNVFCITLGDITDINFAEIPPIINFSSTEYMNDDKSLKHLLDIIKDSMRLYNGMDNNCHDASQSIPYLPTCNNIEEKTNSCSLILNTNSPMVDKNENAVNYLESTFEKSDVDGYCNINLSSYENGIIDIDEFKHIKVEKSRDTFDILDKLLMRYVSEGWDYIGRKFPRSVITGPSGLTNKMEMCYMNAMIQALAASDTLVCQLTKLQQIHDQNKKLKDLVNTLNDINQQKSIAHCTKNLRLFSASINWNRTSQEDAFHAMSYFINTIEKENVNKQLMAPKFQILHTFSENPAFSKVQSHLALSVPLCGSFTEKPGSKITSLMDGFFEASLIDEGPNTTKMYIFQSAPNVLLLHIQANEWDPSIGTYIKPKYYIEYNEKLIYSFPVIRDLKDQKPETVKVEYQLVSVVKHMGDVSGGHYVTYRRHRNQWYLTNDEQVEKIPFKCEIVPYILVYEKKRNSE